MAQGSREEDHKYYSYEMLLVYTDDILVISHRAKEAMSHLDQHFLVKKDSIGPSTTYLSTQVGKYTFLDEPECKLVIGIGEICEECGKTGKRMVSKEDKH